MHPRALCVYVAVLVAACSNSGTGTPVGSTADAEAFCTTMSKIAFAKAAQCLSVAPAVIASWDEQVAEGCATVQHEVEAGRAAYDAAKGYACAHALAAL